MVSPLSISGIIFMFIVSVFLPTALFFLFRSKLSAGMKAYGIGLLEYLVFGYILKGVFWGIIGSISGSAGSFFGFAAAAFVGAALEELGKYYVLTKYFKDNLTPGNAVALGIGHAGGEAIFVSGLTSLNYITAYVASNSDAINFLLPENKKALTEMAKFISEQSPVMFWLSALQTIAFIICQIAFTMLVFKAIKTSQPNAVVVPIILHATIIAASSLPAPTVGIAVATTSVLVIFAVVSYFIIVNNLKTD